MLSIRSAFARRGGIAIGCWLIAAIAILAALTANPTQAQPPDNTEYIGRRECVSCHSDYRPSHIESAHNLTLREADEDGAVLGNLGEGEDVRTVLLPGESEPRAFTINDLAYVVGAGRHFQRYLVPAGDEGYWVLPAEWNVLEQRWQLYAPTKEWPGAAYDWQQNCAGCHTTNLAGDSWEEDAVQCEACHGPGSAHADAVDEAGREFDSDEIQAIRAAISPGTDLQVCGSCHSAGTQGDFPFPTDHIPGQPLINGYQLVMPDDSAHWRSSGHASQKNMQFNEWYVSGHASSLTTLTGSEGAKDSCLACHSGDYLQTRAIIAEYKNGTRDGEPPSPITLDTAQSGITCATCHTAHNETAVDAMLVESPETLCLGCHRDSGQTDEVHHPVVEMFSGMQIVENVPGTPSNHLEAGATCVTCHMPPSLQTGDTWYEGSHTMKVAFPGDVEEGESDSCTTCHTDLSRDYLQEFIEKTQTKVSDRLAAAQTAVDGRIDLPQWVYDAVNFVAGDGSLGVHNYAYTTQLLDAVEAELGITVVAVPDTIPARAIEDPQDCAECHAEEHNEWHQSPHANASLSQTFQQEYAATGRPSYCMSCHASGYDPRTEQYVFEGVVCSNCHYVTAGAEHPPGPVEIATDSQVCGRCHSGAHSPTYDEWLISEHNQVGIDCVDCHTPHDNGLLLDTVNETCGSCHQEALVDEIHMGDDMNCADCHMTRVTNSGGVQVISTGHSMNIDPGVCADCHGNTHLLSSDGKRLTQEEHDQLVALEAEVTRLEETADQNLNSGIVGGALGALVLAFIVFIVMRLGRLK
jgi:predicted CXXCH cytochrome family protein